MTVLLSLLGVVVGAWIGRNHVSRAERRLFIAMLTQGIANPAPPTAAEISAGRHL